MSHTSNTVESKLRHTSEHFDLLYSHDQASLVYFIVHDSSIIEDCSYGNGMLQIVRSKALNTVFMKIGRITYALLPRLRYWQIGKVFIFPVPSGGYWKLDIFCPDVTGVAVTRLTELLRSLLRFQQFTYPFDQYLQVMKSRARRTGNEHHTVIKYMEPGHCRSGTRNEVKTPAEQSCHFGDQSQEQIPQVIQYPARMISQSVLSSQDSSAHYSPPICSLTEMTRTQEFATLSNHSAQSWREPTLTLTLRGACIALQDTIGGAVHDEQNLFAIIHSLQCTTQHASLQLIQTLNGRNMINSSRHTSQNVVSRSVTIDPDRLSMIRSLVALLSTIRQETPNDQNEDNRRTPHVPILSKGILCEGACRTDLEEPNDEAQCPSQQLERKKSFYKDQIACTQRRLVYRTYHSLLWSTGDLIYQRTHVILAVARVIVENTEWCRTKAMHIDRVVTDGHPIYASGSEAYQNDMSDMRYEADWQHLSDSIWSSFQAIGRCGRNSCRELLDRLSR